MTYEINKMSEGVLLEDVSREAVVTIRCLSAIPADLEALLAEIADQEEALLKD